MIIEFIGLPGSGKTSISKGISSELKNNKNKVLCPSNMIGVKPVPVRISIKLFYTLLALFASPLITTRYISFLFASKQNSLSDFIKNLLNILYNHGLYIQYRNKPYIVLMDQGILQGLWSIVYTSTKKVNLSNRIALPPLCFSIKCSFDSQYSRLKKRPGNQSRVEKNNEVNKKNYIKSMNILEQIEKNYNEKCRFVSLENEKEMDEVIHQALSALKKLDSEACL